MLVRHSSRHDRENLPLDREILNLTILVIQGLEDAIHSSGSSVVIIVKKIRLSSAENSTQIVQRHEPIVRIGIVELG